MKPTFYLSMALILACGVIYFLVRHIHQEQAKQEANELILQAQVDKEKAGRLADVTRLTASIQAIREQKEKDSLSHIQTQGRLKRQANASRARITGPPVVQDTVIVFLDSLVADLEQQRDTLYIRDNALADSLQRQVSDLNDLFTGELKRAVKAELKLEREKRKRFSVGPHAGYGFRGADVGISVQYSLFRF
jgi:hypothetical protein